MVKILTLVTLGSYLDIEVIQSVIKQDFKEENDILLCPYNPFSTVKPDWGQNIVLKQNKAKEIVLKHDYTHLFSVEADVLIPDHALKKLLFDNKDIVCGIYKLHSHSGHLEGSIAAFRKEDKGYKSIEAGKDFSWGEIVEVDFLSFGCTLIKREVLENINFGIGLDAEFSMNCKNKGFSLFCDTNIKCGHTDHYKK